MIAQPTRLRRWLLLLALALPLLVGTALYAYSVRLPFFLDDGLLFTMIRDYPGGTPGFRFWAGSPSFAYYRPAVFSIWEFQQMLLGGRFDPFGLHALNVLAFALSASVVAAIARRITGLALAGMLAGLVFALFPFSYNAVTWVASQFHVLMTLALLLAVWSSLLWMDGRGVWSLLLAWACAFLAIFSHENGVLVVPLTGLLIAGLHGPRALLRRRVGLLLIPMAASAAVYVYLVLTVPRPGPQPRLLLEMFPGSFALMIQGLAYPLAALIRRTTGANASTLLLIGLAAAVVIPALVFLARASRRLMWSALFGVAWYILAALPTILLLETEYIRGSWRLLMLSSVGAGIFWGALLCGLWLAFRPQQRRLYYGARALAAALALLTLVVSVGFLAQRRADALLQAAYTWALQAEIQQHTKGAPMVINAPAFLASVDEDRYFLTTGMGVMFMQSYVNYAQQFWAQTGEDFPWIQTMAYHPTIKAAPEIMYAPYLTVPPEADFTTQLMQASDIYVTVFEGRDFYPVYVGGPGMPGSAVPIAQFPAGGVALTEAAFSLSAPDAVQVQTRWQAATPQAVVPAVEVWCDGTLVGQSVLDVWGGTHPFRVWQPGEIQSDLRAIRLSAPVTPECLQVTVGLADEAGGERYPATVTDDARRFDAERVLAQK